MKPLDPDIPAAHGAATVTFTFEGTGNAAGFSHSDTLKVTTYGLHFVEDSTTRYNFSPSLGETADMRVAVVSPPSGPYGGHSFHIGIVRELPNGADQHIDWVNVRPENVGYYYNWRDVDFSERTFSWNGIPSVPFGHSAPVSTGLDVFTGEGK